MGKLVVGLGIIAATMVVIAVFIFYGVITGASVAELTGDSMYVKYHPEKYLDKEWKLVTYSKNLAEFETGLRLEFVDQGVVDAATWDFENEDKTLHVWVRKFDTRENLEEEEKYFMSPIIWSTYTQLLYADVGIAGIRRIPKINNPLSVYVDKNDTMIYMYYYNTKDEYGYEYYNDSTIAEDKKFLIDLSKDMLRV